MRWFAFAFVVFSLFCLGIGGCLLVLDVFQGGILSACLPFQLTGLFQVASGLLLLGIIRRVERLERESLERQRELSAL